MASHSGVSSGLVKHGHRILEGSQRQRGATIADDGVASIGDRDGGDRGLELRRERLTQKAVPSQGSAVTSGVIRGTVAAGLGITVGVEVGWAQGGCSSGRSVPGVKETCRGLGHSQHSTPEESLTWTALF